VSLAALLESQRQLLLVFSDPNCGPCQALLPEIARWQREHSDRLTIALVSQGPLEANAAKAEEHGLRDVLVQADRETSEAYHVHGTPTAVLVSSDRTIASEPAAGTNAISRLVATAASTELEVLQVPRAVDPPSPAFAPVSVGAEAPDLEWVDIDGRPARLRDGNGMHTGVVLWNPGCGFCQQLLPTLADIEDSLSESDSRLLIISTGTGEQNRAQYLRSPIILEPDFQTGRLFGARGTPSAVVIGPDGTVASEVAVGRPAVTQQLSPEARMAPGAVRATAHTSHLHYDTEPNGVKRT
jgi:thiol-disulfide isomerase/thioredoxin